MLSLTIEFYVAAIIEADRAPSPALRDRDVKNLFRFLQCLDMRFESMRVLAFCLQFGLQFLHQAFQAKNLNSDSGRIAAGGFARRHGDWHRGWHD